MSETRIVFVAYDAEGHVGQHLIEAATKLGIPYRIISPAIAFDSSWLLSKLNWHLRGHRPARLDHFGQRATILCENFRPTHLIATGIAPLPAGALREIRHGGVRTINWLTDDPWNRAHRAPWFVETIPEYQTVYTPRSAVIDQLAAAGARAVEMLPFAYCSNCHFGMKREGDARAVVSFVGGADRDRARYIDALVEANVPVELYGGYWKEQSALAPHARGFVDMAGYRGVVAQTAVSLCLVREANRDGHVMRSYELPAMRGCIMAQDTPDHRELYGAEGETVRYFSGPGDIGRVARGLLDDAVECDRLRVAVHTRVVRPENSYYARLQAML